MLGQDTETSVAVLGADSAEDGVVLSGLAVSEAADEGVGPEGHDRLTGIALAVVELARGGVALQDRDHTVPLAFSACQPLH